MYVIHEATRAAIDIARTNGVAVMGVTNTWVSGRSAHYVEMEAKIVVDKLVYDQLNAL